MWWQWNDASLLLAKPSVLGKDQETTWCLWMTSSYYIRGFKYFLWSPLPRERIQFDNNLLQTGWNHQLVTSISLILLFFAILLPLSRGTYDKCMFYTFINQWTHCNDPTSHWTQFPEHVTPVAMADAICICLMDSYFSLKLTYTSISRWMIRRSISCWVDFPHGCTCNMFVLKKCGSKRQTIKLPHDTP